MAYIFDTNIFIRSKNEMPIDLWPTFWTRVTEIIAAKRVFSNEAVKSGYTLVTNETSDPLCRRRVKIPDACNALGVRCCGLNDVLRELGIEI